MKVWPLLIAALMGFHDIEAATHRDPQVRAAFMRQHPCPATGKPYGACPGWQVDHVIPLKCKGPDHPENMQWLTVQAHKEKTAREAKLCRPTRSSPSASPSAPPLQPL